MSNTTLEREVEAAGAFVPGFDEDAFDRLARADEPALLKARREEAFSQYRAVPAPTGREDEWRRTGPELLEFAGRKPLPALAAVPAPAAEAAEAEDAEYDVVVDVGDEGFSIVDRAGRAAAGGLRVLPLAEAARVCPDLVRERLQGAAMPAQPRKFTALVDAFWNFGLLVHAPAGAQIGRGVLVRYRHARSDAVLLPRLLIVAEQGAALTVTEHYRSAPEARFMAIGSREMYVGANARLKLVSLQEWGDAAVHLGEDWSQLDRDACIDWVTLTLGGSVSKLMCGCDVHAPNARALLSGLYFASGRQHFDQRTLQRHSSPHTYSNLLYKGAVKDEAHSVYQGIIGADRGAIKVDAYQMNNNLVLNDGARADSLPGLEIDADDLKCSHGATMGCLDKEQLFYLQSRGLDANEARRTLVNAFFEEVIGRVPQAYLQDRVRDHVMRKLS